MTAIALMICRFELTDLWYHAGRLGAVFGMTKFDIAALERAYASA
jgi:hypothetical protein